MNEPLISIIVPIYKAEKYLHECVDSILAQTYTNLEIILVDDGSPDDCGRICDEYAAKDSRVRVIHKENGGVSGARNAGLDIAKGEYIEFVDSDDTIDADMVELLYKAIMESGAQMAVCGHKKIYADFTRKITIPQKGFMNKNELCQNYVEKFRIYYDVMSAVWNKLFSKYLIQGVESQNTSLILFPEDMTFAEDAWLITCLLDNLSKGVVFVDKTPYNYNVTVNNDSLSTQNSFEDRLKFLSKWSQIMKKYTDSKLVDNVIACQRVCFYMTDIHNAIIAKKKHFQKLKFSQVKTVFECSQNKNEKLSALVMYFFPDSIYRLVFKIFAKQSRIRGEN